MTLKEVDWISGGWKNAVGGAVAGLCSVFGVLGLLRLPPFTLLDGFFLVPGVILILEHVIIIRIKKEKSE